MTEAWRREDITFAQQAASILLPLLQLDHTVENNYVLSIGQSSLFIQGRFALEIIHPAVESPRNCTTSTSGHNYSFARLGSASRSNRAALEKIQEQTRSERGGAMVGSFPKPLRPPSYLRLNGVHSERCCRGDRSLERECRDICAVGGLVGPEPEQLVRDVLRLRGEVAIVCAVLEPPLACNAVHPDPTTKLNGSNESADDHDTAQCEARCVVKVEAYFPVSSRTICVRFRLSPPASAATMAETTMTISDYHCIAKAAGGLCRSRKQQLEILRGKLKTEAKLGFQTMSNVLKQAAPRPSSSCISSGRDKIRQVDSVHLRVNNAFSCLLIRANVRIPMERVCLGNGSWRETVGELVGCPCGVELTTVSDRLA